MKKNQPKIVYSYYVLDIIHKGHLLMMKNAKAMAGKDGKLIVGILTDEATMEKKPKPIMPFEERIELAEAIRYADVVAPQETYSPLPNIKKIKPDILIESASHEEKAIEECRRYMESIGGKVVVLPYFPKISSTNIKQKIKNSK
ncbi:MAG: adenylyltransferase/cytidyltransferase family protein [Patescibacteria group bacterium]|nr:adenylyltransferase/cytidyltransferase family protein [Patescibacteria group bacterium]